MNTPKSPLKIVSAKTLIPMVFTVKRLDTDEAVDIHARIDYGNNEVYFESNYSDLDYPQLREEILNYLRPSNIDVPPVSADLRSKTKQIRSGDYKSAFGDANFGENYVYAKS